MCDCLWSHTMWFIGRLILILASFGRNHLHSPLRYSYTPSFKTVSSLLLQHSSCYSFSSASTDSFRRSFYPFLFLCLDHCCFFSIAIQNNIVALSHTFYCFLICNCYLYNRNTKWISILHSSVKHTITHTRSCTNLTLWSSFNF